MLLRSVMGGFGLQPLWQNGFVHDHEDIYATVQLVWLLRIQD